MKNFYRKESLSTPLISGSIEDGTILIKGRSYPEDAQSFFFPFKNWLDEFYANAPGSIEVNLDFEYINSGTTKPLVQFLNTLKRLAMQKNVKVNWIYEEDDEDMQETGEEFKNMVGEIINLESRKVA